MKLPSPKMLFRKIRSRFCDHDFQILEIYEINNEQYDVPTCVGGFGFVPPIPVRVDTRDLKAKCRCKKCRMVTFREFTQRSNYRLNYPTV